MNEPPLDSGPFRPHADDHLWVAVMPKLAAIVLLVLAPTICRSDPPARQPTAADQQLAEKWLARRRKILTDYPGKVRDLKSLPTGMPLAAEFAQKLEDELASAKMGECTGPSLDFPLVIGAIGTLQGSSFRVIQRLGNSEARIGIKPTLTRAQLKEVHIFGPYPELEVFLADTTSPESWMAKSAERPTVSA